MLRRDDRTVAPGPRELVFTGGSRSIAGGAFRSGRFIYPHPSSAMKYPILPPAKLLAAGAVALTAAWTPLHAQDTSVLGTPSPASESQGKESPLSPAEQQYLQAVAKDNLGEIATAYLAIEKSASNAVKSYAKDLIDTHTKTMKTLMELAAKHGVVLKLEPDKTSFAKLESVGGGEFDKAYAAEAQRLNQQAADQLNGLMGQITASDVKDFAKDDLKDDQSHLKDAQDLAAKLNKD